MNQPRSMAMAIPMPPPTQRVAIPRRVLVSSRKCNSVTRMRAPLAPERVVLSLDRSGAALIGCPDIFKQPNAWPERIIHMNLSRVGTESGPDWDGLKELHETAGEHKIYAAGGVRDEDDLRRLAEFGISGALVATALHNGGIRSLRLDGWSN